MLSIKNFEKLCIQSITDQISPKDKEKLRKWLKQSSKNQKYYDELAQTWKQIPNPRNPFKADVEQEWNRFEKAFIGKSIPYRRKAFSIQISPFIETILKSKLRPVYLLGFVALIISFGILLWQKGVLISLHQTVITQKGQTTEFILSDGTHVRLNSGSMIKFLKAFSESERKVTLTGEAYFRVKHNEKPFFVVTEQAWTSVLGTQFNVWSRGVQTRVIVTEGLVKLCSKKTNNNFVTIVKGQMSRVIDGYGPEQPIYVNPDHLLGWLHGRLVFEKTRLKEAIAEIERYYNVTIKLDDKLTNRLLTAQIENQSIDTVLAKICLAFNAEYKFESGFYYIKPEDN